MLFTVLKRAIERKNYISKEDIAKKISLIYASPDAQLTADEYKELMKMLEKQE